MADLRIRNFSSSAQTRWVNFVMPRGHALAGSAYLGAGNGIIAARQDRNFDPARDADGGDWIYSVRSAWGGGSNTLGTSTLVDLSALGTDPRWSLELDDFYASGVCGSQTYNPSRFPIVKIAGPGGFGSARATIDLRGVTPRVVYSGNRYRCIEVETHQDGFHVFFTLHMWHQQVLGEWTLDVTWSDETVTDTWYLPSAGIEVDFGATPVRGKWQNLEGWTNTSNTRLTASSQVTRFRLPFSFDNGQFGSMNYGNWNNTLPHGVHLQFDGWMGRAADLTAADHLEAVCTSDIWQGHYLNSGVVPDVPANGRGDIVRPESAEFWSSNFGWGGSNNCTFVPAAGGTPAYIQKNSGTFPFSPDNDSPSGIKHLVVVSNTVSNNGTYTVSDAATSTTSRIYVEESLTSETDASTSITFIKRGYYHWWTLPRGYGGSEPKMPLHFNRRPADAGYQGGFGFIHGGMVVHGDQPLIDFRQASKDFGRRPRYIMRSGQMAPESTGLSLSRQHPFVQGNTTYFGRDPNVAGIFGGNWCRPANAARGLYSNTTSELNQVGIDPQHMSASALLAYYQLSLDPAAERLIHELVETEKLNNRSPAIDGSDFSGDREVGRWLATFGAIYKTFPRGSRVAVRLGDMLDVGRDPPARNGTSGSGAARLFKWAAFSRSWNYTNPTQEQRWNKGPIDVNQAKIVDNGTVGFDATAKTIYRTDAFWDVTPTNNRMVSVFAGAGNANTKQFKLGSRKIIASGVVATVTGGNTITISAGTWAETPIVGRAVRVTRAGVGGYTVDDILASGSNTTTVVLTNNTVANESATFTIEEATVTVDDAATEKFTLQTQDTVKTFPNVTTAAAAAGISIYTTGFGFSNSDAQVIDRVFGFRTAGYVSPLFELMCGGGMYACYLATGETEWRDLALAVLENVVREGWIRAYDGSTVRRVYPWLMLADDVSGRRAPNQPRDLNVAANVSEGMHWYGVGGDKLRSWAAPGLYVAANYHPDTVVQSYAQEALDYINETAVSGWLTNHYVAAVTGS